MHGTAKASIAVSFVAVEGEAVIAVIAAAAPVPVVEVTVEECYVSA